MNRFFIAFTAVIVALANFGYAAGPQTRTSLPSRASTRTTFPPRPAPPPPSTAPVKLHAETIDAQVKSLIDGEYCTGMVIGVIDSTGTHVHSYGLTAKVNGKIPDGDTVFEIGSVTKIFTATVLAIMAEKNELMLNQPVDTFLKNMKIPADGGNKIWFSHLASHTSGLPLHPSNLNSPRPDNPYAGYTQRQLEDFLARTPLTRTPGEKYEYSHVGYAILGQALAAKSGKSYEQTVIDRVCTPLGMKDTRITLAADALPRLAHPYTIDGDEVELWDDAPVQGAFGLRSTANDLLKFASAHIGLTKVPFALALQSMQERQTDVDRQNDMALGWQVGRRLRVLWHNGETGGSHSFLACLPDHKAAIVVLANASTTLVDTIGTNLIRNMIGEPTPPLGMKIARKLDPKLLDQYVGEYELAPNFSLIVTRNNDNLYIAAPNQAKLKLYAESETVFFGKTVDRLVEFAPGDNGKIEGLYFNQPRPGQAPLRAPGRKIK
jgi:CubicO group peptidase (beta-lactamase class C family)